MTFAIPAEQKDAFLGLSDSDQVGFMWIGYHTWSLWTRDYITNVLPRSGLRVP